MNAQNLVKEICPTTTQEWIKKGALLVDVREENEVAELAFDVPSIMNIPLSEFESRFAEIPKDRDVIMVCRSGGRSLRAAGYLINHGFNRVVNMEHGMIRWAQKGFPTIGDTSAVLGANSSGSCCAPTPETKDNTACCNPSPSIDSSKCC